MRKFLVVVLCFVLVISSEILGLPITAEEESGYRFYSSDSLQNYYLNAWWDGKMATPPILIGDATANDTVNVNDALLVLHLSVRGGGGYTRSTNTLAQLESYSVSFCQYGNDDNFYLNTMNWKDHSPLRKGLYAKNPIFQCFARNTYFVSDVSGDYRVSADDALIILQYVVGKRKAFPRTDYSGEDDFQYMVWPNEWYPTMYYDLRKDDPTAYDKVAQYFPDIPPMKIE